MTYAFYYDAPGNERIYRLVSEQLGEEPPPGLLASVVTVVEGGLRHLDVWETREQWLTYRDDRVRPAVTAVLATLGIPAPSGSPEEHPLELVDVGPHRPR